MIEFNGFPEGAVAFLQNLSANNSRKWFNDNKKTYEQTLKQPAAKFCEAMSYQLAALTDSPVNSKVFRIHRDVRFSKDKTPYNTHLHISFIPEGGSDTAPAWFFGLEKDRLVLGGGIFAFDKQQLIHYREYVDNSGDALNKILQPLLNNGFTQPEPELKRVPNAYDKDHAQGELLRRKGLTVWYEFENNKVATSPEIMTHCMEIFTQIQPLISLLGSKF